MPLCTRSFEWRFLHSGEQTKIFDWFSSSTNLVHHCFQEKSIQIEYHDSQHCEIVVSRASTSSSLNLSPPSKAAQVCVFPAAMLSLHSKEEQTTEKTPFEAQGQKEILGDEKTPPPSSRMSSVNSANRKRRRTEGNNVFKKPKFFLRENQSPQNTKRRNKNRKTATRKRALPQTNKKR